MEDLFREQYRVLNEAEKRAIASIKEAANQLINAIPQNSAGARAYAVARTKLEESVMWAVKGVRG